jgi:hypothetical protein
MADNIQVELNEQLVEQQNRAFGRLMATDKETRQRIRKIIREELKDAAKRLREDAKYELKEDPRKAFRAVKSTVYRKILGGNVSILNPKKAGNRYQLVRERKLDTNPHQRGGNRRPRSARTEQVDSYFGKDRAFILRFVSSGTAERKTRYGNRGSIAARNWFQNMAPREMELAAGNLAEVIEDELAAAYNEIIK